MRPTTARDDARDSKKICPKCNKPLTLALPPGGKGPRAWRCLHCDGPDPLKSEEVERWLNSPLKPPAD
jgi:hypothetical protein